MIKRICIIKDADSFLLVYSESFIQSLVIFNAMDRDRSTLGS